MLADDLSRNRLSAFLSKVPSADPVPVPLPPELPELLLDHDGWMSLNWTRLFGATVTAVKPIQLRGLTGQALTATGLFVWRLGYPPPSLYPKHYFAICSSTGGHRTNYNQNIPGGYQIRPDHKGVPRAQEDVIPVPPTSGPERSSQGARRVEPRPATSPSSTYTISPPAATPPTRTSELRRVPTLGGSHSVLLRLFSCRRDHGSERVSVRCKGPLGLGGCCYQRGQSDAARVSKALED